jgi:hypothetical protein
LPRGEQDTRGEETTNADIETRAWK